MIHTLDFRYTLPTKNYGLIRFMQYKSKTWIDKQGNFIGYQLAIFEGAMTIKYRQMNNKDNYIYIMVNLHKLLDKTDICDTDYIQFIERYQKYINKLFYFKDIIKTETLSRIDYCYDYVCKDEAEKKALLKVLSNSRTQRYSTQKKVYSTAGTSSETVYFNNKKANINIYDKENERISKGNIKEAINFSNVIRYEVQLKNDYLQQQLLTLGLARDIINYFSISSRNYYV